MTENLENRAAVALRYEPEEDAAPRVTAKGRGLLADRIIELARQNGVPLRQDPGLVEILSRLELDQAIPPEAYRVVAEILAFVYTLNEDRKRG
ncbi:MAG: EscU/YscU/HrcU family type III secretion system export apparatus switch protein [Candidatus Tectomicrobia bacterium]|nr:EscU/YscU/HrcU family type III secretion system export apparatus switch protein [Candidatus Tectomicrobia bacterium]